MPGENVLRGRIREGTARDQGLLIASLLHRKVDRMHGVRVRWNRKAERAEGIAPLQLRIAFQYRISYTPLSPTPCPSVLQLPVRIRPAAFVPLKLQELKSYGHS